MKYQATFASRLKYAMDQKKLKPVDVSNVTGLSKPLISQYLAGKFEPKNDRAYLLGKALNVNPAWLMGLSDEMHNEDFNDIAKIPLYGPLCCGNGAFVDDNVVDYVSLPIDRLNPRIEYFCQIAQGDSMIGAGIHDGDVLVFEKSSSIDSGQIGCFCIDDNDAVCKRYKVLSDSQILLMPANDKYDPIPVDVLSHSFRCLGILRWAICDMGGR